MRRFLPSGWLGTYLLVTVLTTGCQHHRTCCTNGTITPAATMADPVAMPSSTAAAGGTPAAPDTPPTTNTPPLMHTASLPGTPNKPPTAGQLTSMASPNVPTPPQSAATMPHPRFDHDPNYRWLVGTLDYSRIQRGWLLRYVSLEQDDRYGGCVTLVAPNQETQFKRGQTVRVEGSLVDPESRQLRPAYQVSNVRVEEP